MKIIPKNQTEKCFFASSHSRLNQLQKIKQIYDYVLFLLHYFNVEYCILNNFFHYVFLVTVCFNSFLIFHWKFRDGPCMQWKGVSFLLFIFSVGEVYEIRNVRLPGDFKIGDRIGLFSEGPLKSSGLLSDKSFPCQGRKNNICIKI
jgi:hypothetical protein